MNLLDLIIIFALVGSIMRGYQIGLIRQVIHFVGYFVAFFMAFHFSKDIVPWIQQIVPTPTFQQSSVRMFSDTFQLEVMFYHAIAFFLIFMLTKFVLNLGGAILHQVASLPGLAIVNQTLGATLGFIQMLLILIILVNILSVMPSLELNRWIEGSLFSQYIYKWTPMITKELYNLWNTSTISSL
ncbi:CvpA family protein [Tepidibacillus fermentans]|uniref:Putative membrane protein required for colicin V production n=1 Tax=Tepidibacillus fermentans TaxID=1281767 RepID=A0A4R3KIZ2_9BACI|nr:CvpA family protein [Tepidibacillus fermentans]TCS83516.1 putative membrane protein required for colicin V production [Tepidibacillus fermentans]